MRAIHFIAAHKSSLGVTGSHGLPPEVEVQPPETSGKFLTLLLMRTVDFMSKPAEKLSLQFMQYCIDI